MLPCFRRRGFARFFPAVAVEEIAADKGGGWYDHLAEWLFVARDIGDTGCAYGFKERGDRLLLGIYDRVVGIEILECVRVRGGNHGEAAARGKASRFFVAVEGGRIKPGVFYGIKKIAIALQPPLQAEIAVKKRMGRQDKAFRMCGAVCADIGKCSQGFGACIAVEENKMSPSLLVRFADFQFNAGDKEDAALFTVRRVFRGPRGFAMAGEGEYLETECGGPVNAFAG